MGKDDDKGEKERRRGVVKAREKKENKWERERKAADTKKMERVDGMTG